MLLKSVFAALVLVIYTVKALPMDEQDPCLICWDELAPEDQVRVFECDSHPLHRKCADEWIRTKGARVRCPMCRVRLKSSERQALGLPEDLPQDNIVTGLEPQFDAIVAPQPSQVPGLFTHFPGVIGF